MDRPGAPDDATVLVVDDEPQLTKLHATMLDDSYEVVTATNGRRAIELLETSPSVVLLDRRMPDLTGDAVASKIHNADVETRVALVSAIEPTLDVLEVPFDEYLIKPVDIEGLQAVVDHLCDRYRYPEGLRELLTTVARLAAIDASSAVEKPIDDKRYHELVERKRYLQRRWDDRLDSVAEWDDNIQLYQGLLASTLG